MRLGENRNSQRLHFGLFFFKVKTICFKRSEGGDEVKTCDYLSLINDIPFSGLRQSQMNVY